MSAVGDRKLAFEICDHAARLLKIAIDKKTPDEDDTVKVRDIREASYEIGASSNAIVEDNEWW